MKFPKVSLDETTMYVGGLFLIGSTFMFLWASHDKREAEQLKQYTHSCQVMGGTVLKTQTGYGCFKTEKMDLFEIKNEDSNKDQ